MIYTDTAGHYVASMSLQYDAKGRVVQMKIDNPPNMDSLIHNYEYYASMVVEDIFYRDNTKYGRTIYDLDSDGRAISETDKGYSQNGDSSIAQTVTYKYEAGYMTEKKTCLFGDTAAWTRYTWQILNGNTISMSLGLAIWGGAEVTETYTYYPGSVSTIGNENAGKSFLGKSGTNLVKTSITNNSTPSTGSYSYTYDAFNRVSVQMIRGNGLTSNSVNIAYTYY